MRLRLLACLPFLLLTRPAFAQPDLPAEVVRTLEARIAADEYPGVVVGVIDADGPRVLGFGVQSNALPNTPDGQTRYEIGSITKVFTALLLADAVTRDEVALDDPVAQYLPDSVRVPGGDAITLAHLADHTSGLARMPMNLWPPDPSDPFAAYDAADLYAYLSAVRPQRAPGEAYEYSNLGAGLLGHVLARRAGTTYEALVRERLTGPLGLDATTITLDDDAQAHLAPGHAGGRPVPDWHFDVLAGAGALRAHTDDMLRFLGYHLGFEPTPLARPMAQTATPRQFVGMADSDSLFVGLGWHVRQTDAGPVVWHNGGTGGYRTFAGYDPAAGRGIVVLANSDRSVDDIGFHLLDPTVPLEVPHTVVAVPVEMLARYVGAYRLRGIAITITRENDRLFAEITGQPIHRLDATSETRFRFRNVEAALEFTLADDGRVTGFTLYQNGLELLAERVGG